MGFPPPFFQYSPDTKRGETGVSPLSNLLKTLLVVSAASLEAIAAVNRLGAFRLERHLGLYAATSADRVKQLTGSTAAVTATAATTSAAAAVTATTSAAAATSLFSSIPARLAFFGFLEPFGEVKFLFFPRESKIRTTGRTDELFVFHLTGLILMSTEPGVFLNEALSERLNNLSAETLSLYYETILGNFQVLFF